MKKKLREKLDKVFSQYIRLRKADRLGNVTCFTCGRVDHYKKMHAGHFQSRSKYPLRWDTVNVQVQCPKCNLWNHGEQYVFGCKLDETYGQGTANRLEQAGHKTAKFSEGDYRDLIDKYTAAVKELEKNVI